MVVNIYIKGSNRIKVVNCANDDKASADPFAQDDMTPELSDYQLSGDTV